LVVHGWEDVLLGAGYAEILKAFFTPYRGHYVSRSANRDIKGDSDVKGLYLFVYLQLFNDSSGSSDCVASHDD
jgi:hypothetical protein